MLNSCIESWTRDAKHVSYEHHLLHECWLQINVIHDIITLTLFDNVGIDLFKINE